MPIWDSAGAIRYMRSVRVRPDRPHRADRSMKTANTILEIARMTCFYEHGLGVRDLGVIAYPEALALQHRLVEERRAGIVSDLLLLCGHPAVITRGRGTPSDEPVPAGIAVVDAERGGELTWHGPGQLVGYPIIDLEPRGRDVRAHLRNVEEVVIRTLAAFGLTGTS